MRPKQLALHLPNSLAPTKRDRNIKKRASDPKTKGSEAWLWFFSIFSRPRSSWRRSNPFSSAFPRTDACPFIPLSVEFMRRGWRRMKSHRQMRKIDRKIVIGQTWLSPAALLPIFEKCSWTFWRLSDRSQDPIPSRCGLLYAGFKATDELADKRVKFKLERVKR